MEAVYYKIDSYEGGAYSTGSRKSNYHCYCLIYDAERKNLPLHPLSDVFYGKWRKCESVIKKWQKAVDKNKLQRLN